MDLLRMQNISKTFPGVRANDEVSLTIREGEIHALLGENGAGKTTLMNILYGLYEADAGEIFWHGEPVRISSPDDAIRLGIGMVHQHFMLVKTMTVLQNIVLGLRETGYPFYKKKDTEIRVRSLIDQYGLRLDLDKEINELSVGIQQRVEIVKALYRQAKLLILDEPTAVLTPQETEEFFGILKTLKERGHSIILISHNLSDIMSVSDRVTVLRDGRTVFQGETEHTSERALSRQMVGREVIFHSYERRHFKGADVSLQVEHLTLDDEEGKRVLDDISLTVHKHEVLGIAGVDGNGQTELAEVITGIRRQSDGSITLGGVAADRAGIRERAELGLAYIPADRHRDALIMDAEVVFNLHLKDYYKRPFAKGIWLDKTAMRASGDAAVAAYNIRTPSLAVRTRLLSGGNQQKVILAREMRQQAKVLVACQPTRGLDVGATVYVRDRLIEYREQAGSVLLISTDLNEILSMSDRIAVLYRGCIMGVVKNSPDLSIESLGLMMGGKTLEEVMR